ncbi:hypothetical protein F442_18075 [Phytophthora nicotianae P10297]|uniref:Uncharacterized protein n=2 Tax=Phytophthora nicotianae TaxID=4792 RepID=W2YEN0_PHYNI|nr:hypothetical protein F444_18260 [Phytophthora nicotianae P1976]ETP33421.1 hypothetical protein F442_18075 [Phytophthora nicotianae P10297]
MFYKGVTSMGFEPPFSSGISDRSEASSLRRICWVPGARVEAEVWDPSFGSTDVEHAVQQKAFCDEGVMLEWIARVHNRVQATPVGQSEDA